MYKFEHLAGNKLQSHKDKFKTIEPIIRNIKELEDLAKVEFTGHELVKQHIGWHANSVRGGNRIMFMRDCDDDHLCNIMRDCPHVGKFIYTVIASILEERGYSQSYIRQFDSRGDLTFWK